jgi:ATP-dependent Clp protease ATP-binding subunit ClpC
MKKCSVCKKNIAVIFATQMNGEKSEVKGICMQCARKMGMPIMDQLMKQTGMSEEDLENLNSEMDQMFQGMDTDGESESENDNSALVNMLKNSFPFSNNQDHQEENADKMKEEITGSKVKENSENAKKSKKI